MLFSLSIMHPRLFLPVASAFDSILHVFTTGGWFMIPLIICSLAAMTIGILRAFALRRELVLPRIVEEEIERLQPGGSPEPLNRLVRDDPAALSRLTRVALEHLRVPRSDNSEAVQARARREIMRLEAGLPAMELIVGISPLLGLLGAISGLVRVLKNFGESGAASGDTSGIAQGIAEVLYTTIFGLAIAVPALIAYTYFARKVEGMAVEMESLMADLLSKCYFQKPIVRIAAASALDEDYATASPAGSAPSAKSVFASPTLRAPAPSMPTTDAGSV
jgi:biopolymer transport protein ExbB